MYHNDGIFKETRAAIVVDDLTGEINYQTCSDSEFLDRAEEQGHTFTLKGFEKFLYNGEYNALCATLNSTEYIMVRFINIYQDYDGNIFASDEPLGDKGYLKTY